MPRISVHIATRNNERFIGEAIRSALTGPCKDMELLVLDDASTDGNWDAIQKAVEPFPNARVFRSETRLGVCKGRNRLLELCDAEYIVPLDGDDILLQSSIEERADFLDGKPEIAGAYGKIRQMTETGEDLRATMGLPFSRFNLPYENMICHGGQVLRRADAVAAGGYQETGEGSNSIAEDICLWYRLVPLKDLFFFDRYVLLYRRYEGQITGSSRERFDKVAKLMMERAIAARPQIAGPLSKMQPLELRQEDFRAAVLLLGVYSRCVPPDSDAFGSIVEMALKLAPDDYGAIYRAFAWRMNRKDFREALALSELMLAKFGSSSILRINAIKMRQDVLKASGVPFDNDALEKIARDAAAEYAAFDKSLLPSSGS